MTTIETAALSDPGRLRSEQPNEDTCYASVPGAHDRGTLLAIADGVGGMPGGRETSLCAVEALAKTSFADEPQNAMREAFVAAGAAVRWARASSTWLSGASTTLVAAFLRDGHACIANLGDSRAYLVRNDQVTLVTHDRSYVRALFDAGELSVEAVGTHRLRNVITRVVGDNNGVPDIFEVGLDPGDVLILCSDGLWAGLSERGLADLVRKLSPRPRSGLAQALVDVANGGGAQTTSALGGAGAPRNKRSLRG